MLCGWPAAAQVVGAVTLQSDYIFRGYSLSARKPALIVDLSYDHPSGLYLNGSAIADQDYGYRPALLGAIANLGYARRLSPKVSLDLGLSHLDLFQRYGAHERLGYTEAYAGVLADSVSARLYYSPGYFRSGVQTLYGEVDWASRPVAEFRFNAHLGWLDYLALPAGFRRRGQYDWRLGVSRPLGPFDLHLALTGGGPGPDFYDLHPHNKTALSGGVSWTF
jgi:uncharacterized protein (TIGR02001 family)